MRRFAIAAGSLVAGALFGAVAFYALVLVGSDNSFDRRLEATMTAAFVGLPAGGLAGLVIGLVATRRRSA